MSTTNPVPIYGKEDAIELFAVYRAYLNHEDDLINQRLSWNLTLQGLLFAAYGVTFQVVLDPLKYALAKDHRAALFVFAGIGIVLGTLVLASVRAAEIAIQNLNGRWEDIVLPLVQPAVRELLPGLTGGGEERAHKLGKRLHSGIPAVIIGGWVILVALNLIKE